MSDELIPKILLDVMQDVAAIKESLKSAHKRIDDNDRITEGIHKLATNVEALTIQVKHLTDRMDTSVQGIEGRLKAQGERIGTLEAKPAKRWESVVMQVITYAVALALGAVFMKIM